MPIYWQPITASDTPRHPSISWANWKNDRFQAWNRDLQAEEEIQLPESFIVVAEWWSVKGYLKDKGWIWSNEIYSFAKEPLTIRNNTWEILYEWLWKDIKDKVKAVGLKLTKNVHYVDPDRTDVLRTFCIKGAWLKSWLETFADDNRFAASSHLICFKWLKSGKTWGIKYTYPTFGICDDLTQDQMNAQQLWWAKLIAYQEKINATDDEIKNEEVVKEVEKEDEEDDGLPF